MDSEEDLADAVEDELARDDVGDPTENRYRFKREEPVVKITSGSNDAFEEANEPIAKQEREAKSGHDQREQTVRVVVDRPKAREKEHFDEGLTDEEKAEYKRTRLEEKRATLAERNPRLTQRKRNVEDAKFRENINILERSGTYRKARIVGQPVAPARVEAHASAQGQTLSVNDMVGQVRGLRRAPPFNPVVASQSQRANYFSRGHLSSAPSMGHPLTMTHARPNYYVGPKLKSVGSPMRFGAKQTPRSLRALKSGVPLSSVAGKQTLKTRWKRAW